MFSPCDTKLCLYVMANARFGKCSGAKNGNFFSNAPKNIENKSLAKRVSWISNKTAELSASREVRFKWKRKLPHI